MYKYRSPEWDVVRSGEWRSDFLRSINGVPGFPEILRHSRETDAPDRLEQIARISDEALTVVDGCERKTLVAARQYYNTLHLIAFWRFYRNQIDSRLARGSIDRNFPVFRVWFNAETREIQLQSVPVDYFTTLGVTRTRHFPAAFRYHKQGARAREENSPISDARKSLDSLCGKLTLLSQLRKQTMTFFYNWYLGLERTRRTSVWDAYAIHFFLDLFLHYHNDKPVFSAGFDEIFFSSNVQELTVYLTHMRATHRMLDVEDVEAFLARQRRYYLALAESISLEEVDRLNSRKDLLVYDEHCGVVVCPPQEAGVSGSPATGVCAMRRERIKMDGCPFAVTRGVQTNALTELYEDCDALILHLIRHLDEFRQCFA